ncbi:hypothetical protein LGL55_23565 [Clostridium tagluense]|nr:hypothetical protein [Clostridium tagluense]MCB2323714.1 hypothetical protein [Clostridium tagluense]MCB2338317.1 hypothetical protein [Clostridium tagluense]MCB2367160.1 hypothetical protein [Clostridium tagluense]
MCYESKVVKSEKISVLDDTQGAEIILITCRIIIITINIIIIKGVNVSK